MEAPGSNICLFGGNPKRAAGNLNALIHANESGGLGVKCDREGQERAKKVGKRVRMGLEIKQSKKLDELKSEPRRRKFRSEETFHRRRFHPESR